MDLEQRLLNPNSLPPMHPYKKSTGNPTQHELIGLCRELTDHLSAYAISATNFDDDAFATCEKAERLLAEAAVGLP